MMVLEMLLFYNYCICRKCFIILQNALIFDTACQLMSTTFFNYITVYNMPQRIKVYGFQRRDPNYSS